MSSILTKKGDKMKTIEYGINSVIVLFPFCSNFFTYNDEGIRTSKLKVYEYSIEITHGG